MNGWARGGRGFFLPPGAPKVSQTWLWMPGLSSSPFPSVSWNREGLGTRVRAEWGGEAPQEGQKLPVRLQATRAGPTGKHEYGQVLALGTWMPNPQGGACLG